MKILIAGDSWGCGVWGPGSGPFHPFRGLKHRGIEQFLVDDGYDVINVSYGGASNFDIIKRMEPLVYRYSYDYIFYIKTDPLRELYPAWTEGNTSNDKLHFPNYERILYTIDYNSNSCYEMLNRMGVPIHMIGGCGTINETLLEKYSNLKLVLKSIPKYLCPNYTIPEVWFSSDWYKHIDEKWDLSNIDKVLEQQRRVEWLNKNCKHFKDDHAHPDKDGYFKVYQYIKENVLLK